MSSASIAAASKLGNGEGYIYITDNLGTTYLTSFVNNRDGARAVKVAATGEIPLSAGAAAFATTTISGMSGSGTVTSVAATSRDFTVSQQIGATINFTGGTTEEDMAILIADAVNAYVTPAPGTNYNAVAEGAVVTYKAPIAEGSNPNGSFFVLVSTGTITLTNTYVFGGFTVGDDTSDRKVFIDTSSSATPTTPTASKVEITDVVVPKSAQSGIPTQTVDIAAGSITYDRKGRICYTTVGTEGGAGIDDLTDISSTSISDGDIVVLMRENTGEVITVKSTGNLNLTGAPIDFVIDANNKSIWFIYKSATSKWEEIFRTSVEDITDAGLRASGISVGKSGSTVHTILAAGGTTTLVPGTDSKDIIWDGNGVTLAGSAVLTFGGSPIDGDPFYIHYLPVADVGGNTVTIGGVTLTEDQAETGAAAIAFYDTANTTWRVKLLVDAGTVFVRDEKIPASEITSAKLANTAVTPGSYTLSAITVNAQGQITAAADGSSTSTSGGILDSQISDSGTAADTVLTALHTYVMPGNTMVTNGDMIKIYACYTTAANANGKVFYVSFGSQQLGTVSANLNNQTLYMTTVLSRIDANNQRATTTFFYSTTGGGAVTTEYYDVDLSTEDLTTDTNIIVYGQNAVATLNDIVSKQLIVELIKR